MKTPDFSVLMSLYINERAEYFEECMESILRQSVLPTEIVIVEDGPISDAVEERLNRYVSEAQVPVRTVSYEQNRGLGYALSIGVKECRYDLIARMDTDDVAREDRFELQLEQFLKDPELDICGSYIDEFEDNVNNIVACRKVPLTEQEIREYQRKRDAFNHVSVMFKRSAVLSAGNYQSCLLMEDTLLWVNMLKNGAKCMNIPEPLVHVRIGSDMYERRGGFDYFIKYRNGRKRVLETGYITKFDYYYTLAVQFVVALLPGSVRGMIFKKILHR